MSAGAPELIPVRPRCFPASRAGLEIASPRSMMTDIASKWSVRERAGAIALAMIMAAALPSVAAAQAARSATQGACGPRATTRGPAFVFGNQGGNLQRSATKLWADGSVQVGKGARTAPDAAIADSVKALATLARRSSFWTTRAPRITRPTRNPDMAREYVEAHLRCGTKRSLYPADAEPAAFHELFTRLTAVAALAARR